MTKKNKKISSAIESRRRNKKISVPSASHNPFEVRLNRLKHDVIGKKVKTDKGLPGVSRSKANDKRKKTLLKEYKQRFKNNVIIDRRFGEFDDSISAEDKMLKRFTLEKQKHHEKLGKYNLDDDDEELTHFGQSLSTINNFDDIGLDLSDQEDEGNTEEHFGGFLQKKQRLNQDTNQNDHQGQKNLSRQEIMDEVVANSKKKKLERQQTQEQTFELTQQLDTQWKDVHTLLLKMGDKKTKVKADVDDYDRTVNELIFEAKGQPSERLKTEEEMAKEEKKKLEKLEKERQLRMLGVEDEETEHTSADAIVEAKKKKDSRYEIRYKDGKIIVPEGEQDFFGSSKKVTNGNMSDAEEDNNDNEDVSDDESEEESDHEDLFSDDDDDGENEEDDLMSSGDNESAENQVKELKRKKKKTVEADGIPFTFKAPESLIDLLYHVENRSNSEVLLILDRMKKCHHVKIHKSNKGKLEKIFEICLEFIDHLCKQKKPELKLVNSLASFTYELSRDVPTFSTQLLQKKLIQIEKKILKRLTNKGSNGMFPTLRELIFFKLLSLIYPTSDFNHVITTPCLFLMVMILNKAHFLNVKDLIAGLFLLQITLDYVSLSKRYLPEVVTFIAKVLYQCSSVKTPMKKISCDILHLQKAEKNLLLIETKRNDIEHIHPLNLSQTLSASVESSLLETDAIKLSCIKNTLQLTKKVCELYKDLPTSYQIFEPCISLMERLPVLKYPAALKNLHGEVVTLMSTSFNKKRIFLTLQARKPTPLPLLEPSFDENYEVRSKRRAGDKNRNEIEKMKYKLKKETKGAMREIRKDTHFLAKEQLKETIEKDSTRKMKVKQLEHSLATERHDIREMEKSFRKK